MEGGLCVFREAPASRVHRILGADHRLSRRLTLDGAPFSPGSSKQLLACRKRAEERG